MTRRALVAAAAAAAAGAAVAAAAIPAAAAAPPCAPADAVCWNAVALRLTNDVRARRGGGRVPPLAAGSVAALANAGAHAAAMATRLGMVHQNLRAAAAAIGCGAFVSGENIAQAPSGMAGADNPAALCVRMWEDSPPHLANILEARNKEMAFGVYASAAKGVWSTGRA
ncbi:hypothetical protein I4F81_000677 [Pyropia yezoensis]|uniref:Uncharacterized protein n=1 Tax=Pyropia yezoensis TaxID=2788 RepID=A0ACC3BKD0_PYRYE|nr:hypothetical protein I4F81_000677 [Neopyropia yezoensis]